MPFPKAKKVSPVYQDIETGELLKRLTDSEGKMNPDAKRYDTGDYKADKKTPIIAYFVPLVEPNKMATFENCTFGKQKPTPPTTPG